MEVGDLVVTKCTKDIGIVVSTSSTHCAVFIHKNRTRNTRLIFRINKDQLEVINESR